MPAPPASPQPSEIGIFLVPRFSMMAFFSLVEPLRIANRLGSGARYRWRVVSRDGDAVAASNGMALMAQGALGDATDLPVVIVCASFEAQRQLAPEVLGWLRRASRRGVELGAVDTGSYFLAEAGLLDGYRATVHWENSSAFAERYPAVRVSEKLFETDRNRFTCAGGTAAMDMMLHRVALECGSRLANEVSEQLIHERIRDPHNTQRMAPGPRLGVRNPKLVAAITHMEANLEDPLDTAELARLARVSVRQLERLFRRHLGHTPIHHYRELRLRRARALLLHTDLPVVEVAVACGFNSAAHFSRSYRAWFGKSPRAERSG